MSTVEIRPLIKLGNRPFPSYLLRLFENEISPVQNLHIKMCFICMETFLMDHGFSRRLVLRKRQQATRKLPILTVCILLLIMLSRYQALPATVSYA